MAQAITEILRFDALTDTEVTIPGGGAFVANATFMRDGNNLHLTAPDGKTVMIKDYFAHPADTPDLVTADGARVSPAIVDAFLPPQHPGQYAQAGQTANDASPAGKVTSVEGEATIVRADGTRVPAEVGSPVYPGDVIETSAEGAVNLTFSDNTTFAISESARLSIDEFVYDAAEQSGSSFFSILQGMFVYTSGLIGKSDPGDVHIETPVGSIGIRGTVVAGEIAPAGQESTITLVDGAIVVTNGAGTLEMNSAFQTTALTGHDSAPKDMGQMSYSAFTQSYQSLAPVTGNYFDAMKNFAPQDAGNDDAPAETQEQGTDKEAAPDAQQPDAQPDAPPEGEKHMELNPSVMPPRPGTNFGGLQDTTFDRPQGPVQTAALRDPINGPPPVGGPGMPPPPGTNIAPSPQANFGASPWYMDQGGGFSAAKFFGKTPPTTAGFLVGHINTAHLPPGAQIVIISGLNANVLRFDGGVDGNNFDVVRDNGQPVFTLVNGEIRLIDTTALMEQINPGGFNIRFEIHDAGGNVIVPQQTIHLAHTDPGFFPAGIDLADGQNHVLFGDNVGAAGTGLTSPMDTGTANDPFSTPFQGTTGDDIILGREGNDVLRGRGGADTLLGGNGNDEMVVYDDAFHLIDGGAGTDILALGDPGIGSAGGMLFDLTQPDLDGQIQNIEVIMLKQYSTGDTTDLARVKLTADDVFDMTGGQAGGAHILTIKTSDFNTSAILGNTSVQIADADGTGFKFGTGSALNTTDGSIGSGNVTLTGTTSTGQAVTLIIEQDGVNSRHINII